MLRTLFDSKNKHKLLQVFVRHPRRFFGITELTYRTGIGPVRLQAILREFSKQRLLSWVDKNKMRYYQLVQNSAAREELRSFFAPVRTGAKGPDIIERIILGLPQLKFAALTGIYIGQVKAPVDLLLVGDIPETSVSRALAALEELEGREVNYALFSEPEFLNRLYSFDWFVKEIMDHDPLIICDRLTRPPSSARGEKYLKTVFSNVD